MFHCQSFSFKSPFGPLPNQSTFMFKTKWHTIVQLICLPCHIHVCLFGSRIPILESEHGAVYCFLFCLQFAYMLFISVVIVDLKSMHISHDVVSSYLNLILSSILASFLYFFSPFLLFTEGNNSSCRVSVATFCSLSFLSLCFLFLIRDGGYNE